MIFITCHLILNFKKKKQISNRYHKFAFISITLCFKWDAQTSKKSADYQHYSSISSWPTLNIWFYDGFGCNKKFGVWLKPKISRKWEKLYGLPTIGRRYVLVANFHFCAYFYGISYDQIEWENKRKHWERKMGTLEGNCRQCLWACDCEVNHSKVSSTFCIVCLFCTQTECDESGRAMFKVRSVNLYGRGRGEIFQSYPSFSFSICLVSFSGVRSNCGIWGGGGPPSQGQPSKCLWEGRGIIGQHASREASHHDSVYWHVAYY